MPSVIKYATTTTQGTGTAYATPANAQGSTAGTYATFTSTTSGATSILDLSGYNFAADIPANAIINNVRVDVRAHQSTITGGLSSHVQVMDNTTNIGRLFWTTLAIAATTEDTFDVFPLPTAAQVRSSTFKVRFTGRKAANTTSTVIRLDFISVTVHYSLPISKTISAKSWDKVPLQGFNNFNVPTWSQVSGPTVTINGGGSTRIFSAPASMSNQTATFNTGGNTLTVNIERASTGIKQSDNSILPVRMRKTPFTVDPVQPAIISPIIRSSSTSAVAGATTDKAITKPAGVQEGDLLIFFFAQSSGELDAMGLPDGFTQLSVGTAVFFTSSSTAKVEPTTKVGFKVAGPNEPATYVPTPDASVTYRGDMIAIQAGTWDAARFPVGITSPTGASTTSHMAPSITPASGHGLLLSNVCIRSAATGTTFSWTPPTGMTEVTDVTANTIFSMSTAQQIVTTPDATGTKTFALTRSTNTQERFGLASSVFIPSMNSVPLKSYTPIPSYGTTGLYQDLTAQTFEDGVSSSTYHIYAAHVDPQKPAPIVIHLHGDGGYEYDNPTLFTAKQYMATARLMGAIGVIPNAVDKTAARAWWTGTAGSDWVVALVRDLYARYNIDKKRVYFSGFSGGAVILAEDIMAKNHSDFIGGGAMILGGGQATAGQIIGTHSQTFKDNYLLRWHMGTVDDGRNSADNYNGRLYGEIGEETYRGLGVSTGLSHITKEDHNRSALHGPARLQWLINESYDLYGIGLNTIINNPPA